MLKVQLVGGAVFLKNDIFCKTQLFVQSLVELCGGLKMAPHVNKWSPLDGGHKLPVTVIVTTSELS